MYRMLLDPRNDASPGEKPHRRTPGARVRARRATRRREGQAWHRDYVRGDL